MPLGPVQLLLVGFDRPDFSGEVLAELERLRDSDVVRVIDLLVIHKGADGVVRHLEHADLPAGTGTVVGALIDAGGGDLSSDEELWSLDEAIPDDSAAAVALVEHRPARAESGIRGRSACQSDGAHDSGQRDAVACHRCRL